MTVRIPDDAIHWNGTDFRAHVGDFGTAGTNTPARVNCPLCIAILGSHFRERALLALAPTRTVELSAEFQGYRARLPSRAAQARRDRRLAEREVEAREAIRQRRQENERRTSERMERDRLEAFRRRYEVPGTPQYYDRATPLREWERGLDAWPDIRTTETLEAIAELRADRDEDLAHWRDLR